jgi:ribosomal protein S27AE
MSLYSRLGVKNLGKRVRCGNCGMIYMRQPYLGGHYAYPEDYRMIETCPRCGSSAYDALDKD